MFPFQTLYMSNRRKKNRNYLLLLISTKFISMYNLSLFICFSFFFFFILLLHSTIRIGTCVCGKCAPNDLNNINNNKKKLDKIPKAWGLALIWITLSCKWGLAKPIDKLLSHHALLPFSRLTYCAYLIHPVSQIAMSFELKGTLHIQHGLVLTIFLGNAITSYAIALILSLLFEAPVVRMLKILFGK